MKLDEDEEAAEVAESLGLLSAFEHNNEDNNAVDEENGANEDFKRPMSFRESLSRASRNSLNKLSYPNFRGSNQADRFSATTNRGHSTISAVNPIHSNVPASTPGSYNSANTIPFANKIAATSTVGSNIPSQQNSIDNRYSVDSNASVDWQETMDIEFTMSHENERLDSHDSDRAPFWRRIGSTRNPNRMHSTSSADILTPSDSVLASMASMNSKDFLVSTTSLSSFERSEHQSTANGITITQSSNLQVPNGPDNSPNSSTMKSSQFSSCCYSLSDTVTYLVNKSREFRDYYLNPDYDSFKFKDFNPLLFAKIRAMCGISSEEYASSFLQTTKESFSEGR